MLSLNLKQTGFQRGGAAQPPQGTGQPEHQFPLHDRLGIIVGDNGGFEGVVIGGILQRPDHRLGRESMADGIAARALFALLRVWAGAPARIAAVGLDLLEGGHRWPTAIIGFVLSIRPRFLAGRSSVAVLFSVRAVTVDATSPLLSEPIANGCVSSHSERAAAVGSIPAFRHHKASSPRRWTSR